MAAIIGFLAIPLVIVAMAWVFDELAEEWLEE